MPLVVETHRLGQARRTTLAATPFAETECLLAVLEDDEVRATQIANGMTAGEQREFIQRLHATIGLVHATEPTVL